MLQGGFDPDHHPEQRATKSKGLAVRGRRSVSIRRRSPRPCRPTLLRSAVLGTGKERFFDFVLRRRSAPNQARDRTARCYEHQQSLFSGGALSPTRVFATGVYNLSIVRPANKEFSQAASPSTLEKHHVRTLQHNAFCPWFSS